MNMKRNTICISLLAAVLTMITTPVRGQLIINELMQSNIDLVMDDLNDFPDSWVELYNTGQSPVSLGEYKLGLTDDASAAWPLPTMTIAPGGYILIYCDKAITGLHTDFRLDSGKGGAVYLFRGDKVADKMTKIPKQPAPGIAYGRTSDGAKEIGHLYKPTPAAANSGGIIEGTLGAPVFSKPGGVFVNKSGFVVTLSVPDGTPEGAVIRYTDDGSEPTKRSKLYSAPIAVTKTKVIRASLFLNGWATPRSTVQSYIFHGRKQTLPIISIVTDDRYLNDSKIGIYSDATASDGMKNYEHDWRRPVNIELYETDGVTCGLNQLIEARIQGGATRSNTLKSLALYANKRFGEKRLAYEFFPDQRPGQKNFKSLLLRNAGNDFNYLYMRDAIIQRTMSSRVDIDWQAWRPTIIYINGTYRGILNVRERSNEDNIFTNYDELEDIDMIENWWDLKTGTWDNYNAFKEFYTEHGHTMAEYDKWMDTQEFINLMATNLFYCNLDFPGNNIVMWRPRTADGRWRWIMKDTDFGLGLYDRSVNYNTIEWIYNPNYDSANAWANQYDHTRLFRRLMEDPDFNREFIDHCAVYMGDFMNERGTREVWDPMYEQIRAEYPRHRELFNPWWPNYNDEINNARTWLRNRPAAFYKILANYYKVGTPVPLKISAPAGSDATIKVNNIPLYTGLFDGKFFQGRQLTLSSTEGKDAMITGWTIKTTSNGKTTTQTVNMPTYTFAMPTATQVEIVAITAVPDGIVELHSDAPNSLPHKVLTNGEVRILRNGKQYTTSGVEVQK